LSQATKPSVKTTLVKVHGCRGQNSPYQSWPIHDHLLTSSQGCNDLYTYSRKLHVLFTPVPEHCPRFYGAV